MNNKILTLIRKNLEIAFHLPKYKKIMDAINETTVVDRLLWTPARYRKFKDSIESELHLKCDYMGTLGEIVNELDQRYLSRFFGEIWKPKTDEFTYTGWQIVDEINRQNPKAVLDVGCGYHPFKGRINNLVGIDPFNSCADFQVDILEFDVKPESYDFILAFGSINFGNEEDIDVRVKHCVKLLARGGKMYFRANPGITHKNGPYVEIYPWDFHRANYFAEKYDMKLLEFKKDSNDRLYFVYQRN